MLKQHEAILEKKRLKDLADLEYRNQLAMGPKEIKEVKVEKLPKAFGQGIEATKFGDPVKTKGQILKTMARLKMESNFKKGFQKKLEEVIKLYKENRPIPKDNKTMRVDMETE